jgi:hypothetical protein
MQGNSSDLISQVASFYLSKGMKVADVTYGKGVFWGKVDLSDYDFYPSDLLTGSSRGRIKKYDLGNLPYKNRSFDCIVLDPPYMHNPGRPIVEANYRNRESSRGMYHVDILDKFYRRGLSEASRVVKLGGFVWVKCSDEIESGCQCRGHIEVFDIATREFDLVDLDMFILTSSRTVQVKAQQHGRKNYSFLWVFQRLGNKRPSRRRFFS